MRNMWRRFPGWIERRIAIAAILRPVAVAAYLSMYALVSVGFYWGALVLLLLAIVLELYRASLTCEYDWESQVAGSIPHGADEKLVRFSLIAEEHLGGDQGYARIEGSFLTFVGSRTEFQIGNADLAEPPKVTCHEHGSPELDKPYDICFTLSHGPGLTLSFREPNWLKGVPDAVPKLAAKLEDWRVAPPAHSTQLPPLSQKPSTPTPSWTWLTATVCLASITSTVPLFEHKRDPSSFLALLGMTASSLAILISLWAAGPQRGPRS